MDYDKLLDKISYEYVKILKDNLVGIYVHGSIAFGCYNPSKSDIDFLVVTKDAPALKEKEALVSVLLKLDSQASSKGFEMSVVLKKNCQNFSYPTPFELHYSNVHKADCKSNLENYCLNMKGVDADLAAHFTVTREIGITLVGEDIKDVFAPVPRQYYIDSIKQDIENSVDEIIDNPIYIILNLCRVLAYTNDNILLSKAGASEWGIKNLPIDYHLLIKEAAQCYAADKDFSFDSAPLRSFAKYMLKRIFNQKI